MKKKIKTCAPYLLLSIIIVAALIGLACGDMGPDYVASFVSSDVAHLNGNFDSFFISSDPQDHGGIGFDVLSNFNNINTGEWAGYFDGKVKNEDLDYIIYKARLGEIDSLIFAVKKSGYPLDTSLRNCSILKYKDTKKVSDFLFYMGYAKRCEPFATQISGWYDEDEVKARKDSIRSDTKRMLTLADKGQKQVTNAGSDFIKQRYVFQVLRLYFMSGDSDKCINYYHQNEKLIQSIGNSIRFRCMGYLAGADLKVGNIAEADYLYSQIFAGCVPMRDAAYTSFHPQEDSDWNQSLALAKNDSEKINLWFLLGVYADPLGSMQEIYKINPKSELLGLMLMRGINQLEGQSIDTYGGVHISTDRMNNNLLDFVITVAAKENSEKPYLWNLCAGYLEWINGKTDYDKYLDKAKVESAGDSLVMEEARYISIMGKVQAADVKDKNFGNNFLDDLAWLGSKHTVEKKEDFWGYRKGTAFAWVIECIAQKYHESGNRAMAYCFGLQTGFAHSGVLDTIVQIINKQNKTPMEVYALKILAKSKYDIVTMQAEGLVYDYKFKEAVALYQREHVVGSDSAETSEDNDGYGHWNDVSNPFVSQINDCFECGDSVPVDVNEPKDESLNLYQFAQGMLAYQDSLKTDPKNAATYYYRMANGYYNMTYFGSCRGYFSDIGDQYVHVWFGPYSEQDYSIPNVLDCKMAEDYYVKAMNLTKNAELKAKCCFRAAKCEHNYFYLNIPKDFKGDFIAGKYFAMLKTDYSKTQYYKEIIKECGYFRTYLGNK